MRIFYHETVDALVRRLVPAVVVAGIVGGAVAYGEPELQNVPGLIAADAVELGTDAAAGADAAAALQTIAATTASAPTAVAAAGSTSSESFTDGTYKDGTYTGSAQGFGGTISVQVTISGGKITAINITSASGETPSYLSRAKTVISRILSKQSPNVDTVSGCTYSSNGIINAVKRALNKAATGSTAVESVTEETPSSKPSTPSKPSQSEEYTDPDAYKDGVYEGTAEGWGGDVTVKVTVAQGKISAVDIVSAEDETAEYFNKAKSVIAAVIAQQTPNVDVISGATYSSNGILNAIKQALSKAVNTTETPDSSETPDEKPEETPDQPEQNEKPDESDSSGQVTENTEQYTYSTTVRCEPDEYEDFAAYDMKVKFTVTETVKTETTADGTTVTTTRTLSDVSVENQTEITSAGNWTYVKRALNGRGSTAGVLTQLINKQSCNEIDIVSSATCSSHSLINAAQELSDQLALGTTVTTN